MSKRGVLLLMAFATVAYVDVLWFSGAGAAWIRIPAGILFVLLLPGQAMMLAVDPEARLGGFESLTLSISGSVGAAALAGLSLAATVGLTDHGIVLALAAFTLLMLAAAGIRADRDSTWSGLPASRTPAAKALYGAVALLAFAGIVLLLFHPWPSTIPTTQTVQLWGLPNASSRDVSIGAKNIDATSHLYHLVITQGGKAITKQELDLPPGTSRTFVVKRSSLTTDRYPVAAVLTDASGTVAPRSISVWMPR